jgi:hypothetical protein
MNRSFIAVLAIVTVSCSDGTPTSPSAGAAAGPRQTLLPEMTAPMAGTVFSTTGTSIAGATVRVLDGLSAGATATSDADGRYRFERLPRADTNFSATAVNHIEDRRGVRIDGSNPLDFILEPTPVFTRTGTGNVVFDLPRTVTRVRLNGRWSGSGSATFTVRIAGRTIVNENLRTPVTYEGVHLAAPNGGGVAEVINSPNISWAFTEVR